MPILGQAVVFLAAAVFAVPVFKKLGLGAVLAYLAAGALIGPHGLRVITHGEDVLHLGELGVVLLLFIIGLELQPSRLWTMRRFVFGLGSAQVLITGAILAAIGVVLDLSVATAVLVGLTLSLSSTAFALQTLAEKNQLTARHGRTAFSILLFQDLAVIPLIALLPLLGMRASTSFDGSLIAIGAGKLSLLVIIIFAGHYLLRFLLRIVAATQVREAFTAMALLTVMGTALLMNAFGLSMALGAFVAGVLLADSEYRHALEADIEPFKGLLLGLFFMAVGVSLNLRLVVSDLGAMAAMVAGLVAVKFAVLFVLGRAYGLNARTSVNLAAIISQGGEFAFVVFNIAVGAAVLEPALAERLIAVVTLSMVLTPPLMAANEALQRRMFPATTQKEFDPLPEEEATVIIAGFGRVGQVIGRVLRARRIGFTALEASAEQVDFIRKYGAKVYYGNPSRLDLLHAAKADRAKAFVLAIDDVEASLRTARVVRQHFPKLTIVARARNRKHAYQLMDLGVTVIRRETFLSSLDMAAALLHLLGVGQKESRATVDRFAEHDEMLLYAHYWHHDDDEKMQDLAKEAAKELEELFEKDEERKAAE